MPAILIGWCPSFTQRTQSSNPPICLCAEQKRTSYPLFRVSRFAYADKKLNLQLYLLYQGEFKPEDLTEEGRAKTEIYALGANGNTYAPGWYTLNVKAMYRLSNLWRVSAGIENLTDQRHRPYSAGISDPGRNFALAQHNFLKKWGRSYFLWSLAFGTFGKK